MLILATTSAIWAMRRTASSWSPHAGKSMGHVFGRLAALAGKASLLSDDGKALARSARRGRSIVALSAAGWSAARRADRVGDLVDPGSRIEGTHDVGGMGRKVHHLGGHALRLGVARRVERLDRVWNAARARRFGGCFGGRRHRALARSFVADDITAPCGSSVGLTRPLAMLASPCSLPPATLADMPAMACLGLRGGGCATFARLRSVAPRRRAPDDGKPFRRWIGCPAIRPISPRCRD